jgi:hypothetical protein
MMVWDDCLSNEEYKQTILGTDEASFARGINLFNTDEGRLTTTAIGKQIIRAQLFIVIADTPAAGWMSCRNISVGSAKVPCRHCLDFMGKGTNLGGPGFLGDDFLPAVNKTRNVLLTQEVETQQRAEYASTNQSKRKVLQTKRGIKGAYTFFDQVRGFQIVNRVPHDPMHLTLEGVLKYELYLSSHWMAKTLGLGVFALDQMIHKFDLVGIEKSDKPAKIDACHLEGTVPKMGGKIKQTAGMCIVLARNWPLIFGMRPAR